MSGVYFVFGSGGQLGNEFVSYYSDSQSGIAVRGFDLPDGDITNRLGLSDLFEAVRPDAVINAAAFTKVDAAEQQPAICRKINAFGPLYLAQLCRHYDIPLVHFSTDYVFCNTELRRPLTELDEIYPDGVYALTKAEGEKNVQSCPKHLILRTCGLYGKPGPNTPGNFVETMRRLGREKRPLKIVADQFCTPTFITHLVKAADYLLKNQLWGTYHLVNSGFTTWFDFASEIFRLENLDVQPEPITTAQWNAPSPRPLYSILCMDKYLSVGGEAMPTWQQALKEYLNSNPYKNR